MPIGAGDEIPEGFDGDIVFEENEDGEMEMVSEDGLDGLESILALAEVPAQESDEAEAEEEDEGDPEDRESDEDEPEDEPEEPEQPKLSRSQKRIKQFETRAREAEERAAQMEQRYSQYTQQMLERQDQLYNQQLQEIQRQNQLLSEQVRILSSGREREEEERLPEVERFRRKLKNEAKQETLTEAERLFEERFGPRIKKIEELEQRELDRQEETKKRARFNRYNAEAEQVLDAGYAHITDPNQRQILKDMLITTAASYGKPPSAVSHVFEKAANAFGVQRKGKAKATNSTAKARKQLPRSMATKGGAKSTQQQQIARPPWQKIKEAGYRDYHEWRDDGAPML